MEKLRSNSIVVKFGESLGKKKIKKIMQILEKYLAKAK